MVAGAGMMRNGKNHANAEIFLRFMLSIVGQQYFAGQTYEYPLVDGVTTNRLLAPLKEIAKPDVDMVSLSDLQGTQRLLRDLNIIE